MHDLLAGAEYDIFCTFATFMTFATSGILGIDNGSDDVCKDMYTLQ